MQNISNRRRKHSNCKAFDIRKKHLNLHTDTNTSGRKKIPGLKPKAIIKSQDEDFIFSPLFNL